MGKYYMNITKVNCFTRGVEDEANRSHTASKEFELLF